MPLPIEGPSDGQSNAVASVQEVESDNVGAVSDEQRELEQKKKEQVQKIVAHMRQNFGKINVAPEFNDEDLVPVEMPDLDVGDFSDSEGVEESDEDAEEKGTNAEQTNGDAEEPATSETGKAKKSSREVIRELDEKITKYKHFLDRAKSKRFSAIRSVHSPKPHHIIHSCCVLPFCLGHCQTEMPYFVGGHALRPWGLAITNSPV